jgi:manganese/zinc/iron transport system substrate-binding protein
MQMPRYRNPLTILRYLLALLLSAALLCAGVSCGESTSSSPSAGHDAQQRTYPYQIVTTVGMVTDMARNVAGEKATVEGLMGEGVDPHLYKPTRNDVAAMLQADVVMYVGLMLEGKLGDTLVKVARSGKPVHAVTELIDEQYLLAPEEMQGHYDPHVWMDPMAWAKCVEAAAEALSEFDPANAEHYRANARQYIAELERLDAYARKVIETVPPQSRVMITAHDAFGYFGRAYGFDVRGIQGLSTESEAGLKDIQQLVDLIVRRDVRAVFIETSVSEKNIRALVEGTRARGKDVTIGGSLFSDAMGRPGTYEGTYVGMMDHNITTIVRALGGEAPERGMNGKLSSPVK